MFGFFDTDYGSPIPWMAAADESKWLGFEIDLKSISPVESEVPFGTGYDPDTGQMGSVTEAIADMKNIDGADDGEHIIPFWACGPLQEITAPMLSKRKGAQYVKLSFQRTTTMRKGKENSIATYRSELDL